MSYHAIVSLAPNSYKLDLSSEVLEIYFGKGAAKISEVKVRGRKKIAGSSGFDTDAPSPGAELANFFSTSNLNLYIFVASWPKWMFSTSFKNLIHICLEPEAQGHNMTY